METRGKQLPAHHSARVTSPSPRAPEPTGCPPLLPLRKDKRRAPEGHHGSTVISAQRGPSPGQSQGSLLPPPAWEPLEGPHVPIASSTMAKT